MRVTNALAALATLAALLTAGCASAPDPNAPRACFTVDNSEGGGAAGNVWLIGPSDQRMRLGEVGMGRSLTRCFQRTGMTGRWSFAVYSPSADRMDPARGQNQPPTHRSSTFIYQSDTDFVWNVRTGQISLRPAPPPGEEGRG